MVRYRRNRYCGNARNFKVWIDGVPGYVNDTDFQWDGHLTFKEELFAKHPIDKPIPPTVDKISTGIRGRPKQPDVVKKVLPDNFEYK